MIRIRRVNVHLYLQYGVDVEVLAKPGAEWLKYAVSRVLGQKDNGINMKTFDRRVFFNEDPITKKGLNSYPLVLFHHLGNSFFLTGINEGAKMIENMFQETHTLIRIDSRTAIQFNLLGEEQFDIKPSDKKSSYHLNCWIPFKKVDYTEKIKQCSILKDRITNLEERIGLQLIKDLSYHFKLQLEPPKIRITDIDTLTGNCLRYEGYEDYFGFSPVFETNLLLPEYIGLGHGKAFGFGIIHKAEYM